MSRAVGTVVETVRPGCDQPRAATSILQSHHFATLKRRTDLHGTLILASRGDCRIAIRNARWGSGMANIYARDTRDIGALSFLYRGQRYSAPPGLRIRLGRIEFEILDRFGSRPELHVLTAVAASPSCGDGDFGLSDVTIAS
jgi:hypothetical protein